MMALVAAALVVACATTAVRADIYLHHPHGSNNKQSDNGEGIPTTTRLFRSRNRPQGGYNSPLRDSMYYFTGSVLPIEMTFNLGLGSSDEGGHESSHSSTIVLQYMCADNLRDGASSTRISENAEGETDKSENGGLNYRYGMHENWAYYSACKARPRNKGLFTASIRWADNADSARFTRQNPTGTRFGFECPEERDYYPYWLPTPWRDIAIITDTPSRCDYYKAESQNVKERCHCMDPKFDTQQSCPNGEWQCEAPWSTLLNNGEAPECLAAPWLQENILSNKRDGYPLSYNWTVPNEPHGSCALRVRYNVTTGDWPTWHDEAQLGRPLAAEEHMLDHRDSLQPANSVVQSEPWHACCTHANQALCQCQLGHHDTLMPFVTYSDRSHRFSIVRRPSTVNNRVHNLNVRGKRGNIVQTHPAVEYDFVPMVLHCRVGEWIHAQWTGSDNNRNNVAGEGTAGTDRSNMIQILDAKRNYPIDPKQQSLFPQLASQRLAFNGLHKRESLCKDWALLVANNNENNREQDPANCAKLNPAVPYYDGGLVPCQAPGVYYYASTRNNNFSNRSQKGTIVVHPCGGNSTCSNDDKVPVNAATGEFDPTGLNSDFSAASRTTPAVALLCAIVVALLF